MTQLPLAESFFAGVAVADATMYYDKVYTYRVPALLEGHIFVGSIVAVPFGRGKAKPRIGVVVNMRQESGQSLRTKDILDAAPQDAALPEEMLAMASWLKDTTFCTWFEAFRAVLPRGAQYILRHTENGYALQKRLERTSETVYACADAALNKQQTGKKTTKKQQMVLDCLANSPKTAAEICTELEITSAVVQGLLKQGLLRQIKRDKKAQEEHGTAPRWSGKNMQGENYLAGLKLSLQQSEVSKKLICCMEEKKPKPALLHGVTGSGKTVVFLHLINQALKNGKTALVLVPEIGLTSQMLGSLFSVFGQLVAVLHSGLSATQRLLQWKNIQNGSARVVVGTRSAVFAPLQNIGIIIVDEEQEHTYQSESAPRYSAIDAAKGRAARHGALLLLASATPSVQSYYMALNGRYNLFTLKARFGNLPLPKVELCDMRTELKAGNAGVLSAGLVNAIAKTLQEKNQVILLLNRRGYHRVGMCKECGEALRCEDCSVPMVFHKTKAEGKEDFEKDGRLVCHYCGKIKSPAPNICPQCGGPLRFTGFGTQRLEEELAELLPQARIVRMDMDTTSKKGSHAKILQGFANGKADILLGTQMVAKGLDFEKVKLVGVVGIDSLLFGQGYRAFEQVFSLVTQVVGRGGRANTPGTAIIQTVDVNHPVLNLAAKQDYAAFYQQEEGFRKLALYPPFCAICVVGFVAKEEESAKQAAKAFAKIMAKRAKERQDVPLRILGPAPMPIVKKAGSWRFRLTIKCRADANFRALAWQALEDYNKEGWPKKTTVFLDFYAD